MRCDPPFYARRGYGILAFEVKPRLTTWLLAALMTATAAFCIPPTPVTATRASYGIVWVDQAHPAQRKTAELRETAAFPEPHTPPRIRKDGLPKPGVILDSSLFQRPPPPVFFSQS